MSNSWFQFKEFTVQQDRCAMKVSTDACIQGAWTPVPAGAATVLDLGAGTGLLSLMIAQRNRLLEIDAVELDKDAAAQAAENAAAFTRQIRVHQADICTWNTAHQYDLLVCNPPFFSNSLRSEAAARSVARHDDHFSREDMAGVCLRLMKENGLFSVLLPLAEQERWEQVLQRRGLYLQQRLLVRPYAHSVVNRVVSICNRSGSTASDQELIIYHQPGQYTESFAALLAPFYLAL